MIVAGPWFSLPWFALNGFLIRSPFRIQILVHCVLAFFWLYGMVLALEYLALVWSLDVYATRVLFLTVNMAQYALAYFLWLRQLWWLQIYMELGGKFGPGPLIAAIGWYASYVVLKLPLGSLQMVLL